MMAFRPLSIDSGASAPADARELISNVQSQTTPDLTSYVFVPVREPFSE